MPDFQDLYSELQGIVPSADNLLLRKLVNRAWGRIRDYRLWSWQVVADAQLFVPEGVSAGTVTVAFNSTTVNCDAGATAALTPLAFANPPLASPVLGIGRQLRVGGISEGLSSPTGPNYNIVAYNVVGGLGVITIDKPYGETSASSNPFQVLKCYYAPPALPFTSTSSDNNWIRYTSLTNRLNGYTISGKNLYFTQEQLNIMDPQRGGQGDAYIVANYSRNSLGQPVVELYPNPVNYATYGANYITRWPDLTDVTVGGPAYPGTAAAPNGAGQVNLPQMQYELKDCVSWGAQVNAGIWAMARVGGTKELQGTNWVNFCNITKEEWRQSMIQCIKQDDEIMPNKAFMPGSGFLFPLGGEFLQSHDITSYLPYTG